MADKTEESVNAPRPGPNASAARIAAAYVSAAALYILISDTVALENVSGLVDFHSAQIIKGLMFILITGLILFLVIRRLAARLSRQRAAYEQVLQNIGDAVFLVRRADRAIVYANGAAQEMLGYAPEELIGRTTEFLYDSPEEFQRFAELARNQLDETGKADFEFRMRRRDGTVVPTRHRLTLFETAGDRSGFVVSLIRDISSEVDAENKRKLYEHRLRTIMEAVPIPMSMIRVEDDEVIFVNDALRQTLSPPDRENAKHLRSEDFFHDPDQYRALRAHVLENGEIEAVEVRAKTYDDTEIWVAGTSKLIDFDGERMFLTAFMDITAMRENRELLARTQRLESIGQLTGGIAHDFNNLLTVILLNCETVLDNDEATADIKSHLEIAHSAADRAAALTNKLLAFARASTAEPEQLDINAVIAEQYPLLRRTLGSDLEIAVLPSEEPALARIDRSGIENAIINLAVNAQYAMEDGGTINIKTGRATIGERAHGRLADLEPGDYVTISVADTGPGMSPQVAERALEPFFTTKPVGSGTGLGLSTIYGFARAAGGTVVIESEIGRGTTVTMYLPLDDAVEEKAAPAEQSVAAVTGSESILLVEDHREIQEFAAWLLRRAGYAVTTAGDGDRAMALLEDPDAHFDLLFTDIVMPGAMDGYELAQRAKEMHPDIKVLLTTGYSQQQTAGPAPFPLLAKPYTRATLAEHVRQALDQPPGSTGAEAEVAQA